jgi:hypothetical protein
MMSGFNLDIKSEEDFDKDNSDFEMAEKSENCELYREEIINSWDKCIGCDQSINNMFMYKERSVQATFWELHKDQIRKVWHFTCR